MRAFLAALALVAAAAAPSAASTPVARSVIGRSVRGRPIVLERRGTLGGVRVLVVGCIHGDECAGDAVLAALRRARVPAGVELDLVETANPDGRAAGTRQNAHGVDLNRNFPRAFRRAGRPFSTYYSGRRALSEPESRAMARWIERNRPAVSIWYHQAARLVYLPAAGSTTAARRYARAVRLPARIERPLLTGTAVRWENASFRGTTSWVVELKAGAMDRLAVRRHSAAVLAAARTAAARARAARTDPGGAGPRTTPPASAPARPAILRDLIPFGAKRKRETRAYARRHYGLRTYRLLDPHVIVEHVTAGSTFSSAYNTFAHDVPDVELHELPQVCSHFVIDRAGRIHQLVSLGLMCRHTVGLNWTAIGIEHVGLSDAQVLGDRAQMRASLRLTAWLRCRYRIPVRDVIGHAESLSSPFHRERVRALRTQTHGDWVHRDMVGYRARLAATRCG